MLSSCVSNVAFENKTKLINYGESDNFITSQDLQIFWTWSVLNLWCFWPNVSLCRSTMDIWLNINKLKRQPPSRQCCNVLHLKYHTIPPHCRRIRKCCSFGSLPKCPTDNWTIGPKCPWVQPVIRSSMRTQQVQGMDKSLMILVRHCLQSSITQGVIR